MSDYLMEVVDKELINHGIRPNELEYVVYIWAMTQYMFNGKLPDTLIFLGPTLVNALARGM